MGAITEDDITKMLAATTHIGSDNSETTMEQYIFKKKTDGINIINLKRPGRSWSWLPGLLLLSRTLRMCLLWPAAPMHRELCSSLPGTSAAPPSPAASLPAPSLTIQAAFREPRLLLISDPRS